MDDSPTGDHTAFAEEELVDIVPVKPETDRQKRWREQQEKREKVAEFGGPVSIGKLLSLATWGELVVLFVGSLGAFANGMCQPLLPFMFGELVDALAEQAASFVADETQGNLGSLAEAGQDQVVLDADNVARLSLIMVGIGLMVLCLASLQGFGFSYFPMRQVARMKPIYLDAVLHREVSWYDTHDTSSLPSELGEDLEVYAQGLGNKLGNTFMSIGAVLSGFGVGVYLEWKVGLMIVLAVPVMGVGAAVVAQIFREEKAEIQTPYTAASALVTEVLFAIRTVVSFGGEHRELGRYSLLVESSRRGGVKSRMRMGLAMGYLWLGFFATLALSFWWGARLIREGDSSASVGNIVSCFFCILTAGLVVGKIGPGVTALFEAKSAMARFFFMVENDGPIMKRFEDSGRTLEAIHSICFEAVYFAYPAKPSVEVLRGLSFNIQQGQKVAVVGESGCGKSTLMALLERFYDPCRGRVLLNGVDLRNFSVKSFRRLVGYVGQEPVLFTTSVRENIAQSKPDATEEDIKAVVKHANLDFVHGLPQGLDTYVGAGGSQFSGGQKQRISIARALLKRPSVLFLDEATSALDRSSEREIQATIDQIGTEYSGRSMTIVSIAHRLTTITNSDVIFVMQNGRVAESGIHSELVAKEGGLYRALAVAQGTAGCLGEAWSTRTKITAPVYNSQNSHTSAEQAAEREKEKTEEQRAKEIAKTYKVPMRRILTFCRPEWGLFIPGISCALCSGALFPLAGLFLVDSIVAFLSQDREVMRSQVAVSAVWFLGMGALKCFCIFVQYACFAVLSEGMTKRARIAMLTKIFRQEMGYHDDPRNAPGRLAKALRVHTYRIQVLCYSLAEMADTVTAAAVGVVIAFVNSWEMALGMLLSVPFLGIAQKIQMAMLLEGTKEEDSATKAAQQIMTDAIMSVRTVHACACEKKLLSLYTSTLRGKTSYWQHLKVCIFGALAFGFANGMIFWVRAGGFWLMGILIKEGRTDFEAGLRSFMGVLYATLGAVLGSVLAGDMARAKVAAHDIFELLDRKPMIDGLEPDGVVAKDGGLQLGRFEFEDVAFHYPFRPDVQVLDNLSFHVEAGQFVGVVGPSGGGKSTLMSLIQRFYDPQGGRVLIGSDRVPLDHFNIRWWRQQVGFVGQEPILFDATVLENVKYGLPDGEEVTPERLQECRRMAHLNFLDSHNAQGWDTPVGPRGARLSGGQKQRVAICRALVRDPPVLLLDEATSALDSHSEKKVQVALEEARRGRTSFAIAHRLSTIENCDVILVVADGRIVEKGTHAELKAFNGVYSKLQEQVCATPETCEPTESKEATESKDSAGSKEIHELGTPLVRIKASL